MGKIQIDLQGDPLIPTGRELFNHLVGAHLSAADEEELLHMVGVALSEVHSSNIGEALRILTHATYHAQQLLVRLLEIAAERGVALHEDLSTGDLTIEARLRGERLELWSELRSDPS